MDHDRRESLLMKGKTMKGLMKSTLCAVLMIAFGAAVAIAPAHAQTGSRILVNIPFDFFVGSAPLKAGNYTVEETQPGVLAFSGTHGQEHLFALTVGTDFANQGHEPHFVFTRYGTEVFLNRVFLSADNDCQAVPLSSREKKLIQSQASGDELSLLVQPAR
ncbi:MAG: hypothetical protein LAO03_02425 [Acidobacteriia bacterium]|nr:hypothetical protein [Terriglobia bacterium]